MRFTQLRDFVAVMKAGSLRSAAQALGISQPAVTKSIRQLEDELGTKLLQRSGRGATATSAGKALLARARVIQAELAKIEQDLDELRGRRGGSVVVGVSPAAAVLLVPKAVMRLRQSDPGVRVRFVEGLAHSLMALVRDETLDFSVGLKADKPDAAIRFRPLLRAPMIIAGRRDHPRAGARSLRDLADATWVAFSQPGRRGLLDRSFRAAGLQPPHDVVQCESYTSALALMAGTDALGLIVPQLLEEPYSKTALQPIRIAEPIPAVTLGIFRRVDAPLSPAASAMAESITATARELARLNR
jgi:LysR family transcriptional regulator, regulator of abg operon